MEKDLQIQKYKLDEEWLRQPALFQKYSEQLVEAELLRDRLLENLNITKSEVDQKIRLNPKKYGWTSETKSPTEGFISTQVSLDTKVREAQKQYLDAKKDAAVIKTYVEALQHKKSALENCVKLWLYGYWSDPKAPRGEREVLEDNRSETARKMLQESMRDRTKR